MSTKIYVKKEGNVCTVFEDEGGRPIAFNDIENLPMGFPFTMNEGQIRAKYPGCELVMIEAYRPPNPEAGSIMNVQGMDGQPIKANLKVTDQEVARLAGNSRQPEAAKPVAPKGPMAGLVEAFLPVIAPEGLGIEKQLLAEFEILCRAHQSAPSAESQIEVEAVASFLVNALPELEEELRRIAAPKERKRFKL